MSKKIINDIKTGEIIEVELTAEEETQRQTDLANAETERQAEEMLDDYCCGEHHENVEVVEVDEQETTVDYQSIVSSEELGVDEFMNYRDNIH